MSIEHVLAVVPVSDLERADAWYEALFGRPAGNRPMPSRAEWQVTDGGSVHRQTSAVCQLDEVAVRVAQPD